MKTKFITASVTSFIFACSCLVNVASASLITIDFESFPESDFSQGSENGFNISANGPDTKIVDPGFNSGNTAFSDGGSTLLPSNWFFSTNGLFTFEKLDIGSFYNQGDYVIVTGWLGNVLQAEDNYKTTTSQWNGQLSTKEAINLKGIMVDKISISMLSTSNLYGVMDNVVMNKVPEPTSLAIFALGIMGLAVRRLKQ
ncbi:MULTISPECIES: PEP-CTERM sorting domain-containing protein [unclassified Colwellia]|jgi:hypothetical protein|uniref:PEP-CTERM sorting domain-containing protein n=1 Tax=unclassified Colwellia TaxID=196834 RepID=UPI0015F4E73D|nr:MULTISPECIES: PEP-CTERM sorting domain-containing protein [unclassified Colwellia]MBA6335801.1 PEP-CTERM sorting domain-containing protein [Colwellia sp. BRX8-7]MBA6347420.1 PEP-CTERM sorting domain-containing protein [Colwellia sp. BRX8-9]MBA6370333.1 PEP-CTERM sorting domain-containing protein [Colwellia sp. BRX8-4]MBA6377798.1 PEP-CTERM sorting domain-containing protein [Colwellia sp. BRX10-7]MBA6385466.1 PEP-CTERM sorting domain-containing protein [Colwellia sp. BRX10-2]|tara:strand:+ start:523 stop:1116 length:594 start_codon:yes stop_codon:yes gene_type:complete